MGPLSNPNPKGGLFLLDYNSSFEGSMNNEPIYKTIELLGFPGEHDFHPLGFDIFFENGVNKGNLFVINHQRTGPTIEGFEFTLPNMPLSSLGTVDAVYKGTIPAQEAIKSANSIVALSATEVLVTNDHKWTTMHDGKVWAMIETLSNRRRSTVAYLKIPDLHGSGRSIITAQAISHLSFPNGIGRGRDGSIYVASSTKGTVGVYKFTNQTNLMQTDEIKFGYPIDNLEVTQDVNDAGEIEDVVVVGGHPDFFAFMNVAWNPHAESPSITAPSWISEARQLSSLRRETTVPLKGQLESSPQKNWVTKTLYQDDGKFFRTTTGASVDYQRGTMIGTGLYQNGILFCSCK